MNFDSKLNYIISEQIEKYTNGIVDYQWRLYENYKLKSINKYGENVVVIFEGQVEHVSNLTYKDSINFYIIPTDVYEEVDNPCDVYDLCSGYDFLFCKGLKK